MKKAFTMIELVFVIVIIGLLAGVAIHKLSASRDDATISKIVHNARSLFSDFNTYYYVQGNKAWNQRTVQDMTSVYLETGCGTSAKTAKIAPSIFVLCHEDTVCLTFQTTSEGNLTITDGVSTNDFICEGVKSAVSFSNKIHRLGGISVDR